MHLLCSGCGSAFALFCLGSPGVQASLAGTMAALGLAIASLEKQIDQYNTEIKEVKAMCLLAMHMSSTRRSGDTIGARAALMRAKDGCDCVVRHATSDVSDAAGGAPDTNRRALKRDVLTLGKGAIDATDVCASVEHAQARVDQPSRRGQRIWPVGQPVEVVLALREALPVRLQPKGWHGCQRR